MNAMAKTTYPAHCPYEDGWAFCPDCQRFYKVACCPEHPMLKLRQGSKYKRLKKGHGVMREVSDEGLGLPRWALLREFSSTPNGIKSLEDFRKVQAEIANKIMTSAGLRTFGELGATRFRNHWFKRLENESATIPQNRTMPNK